MSTCHSILFIKSLCGCRMHYTQVSLLVISFAACGASGVLGNMLSKVWDLGSIRDLINAVLPHCVGKVVDPEELSKALEEFAAKSLDLARDLLVDELAKKGARDPDALINEWIDSEGEWRQLQLLDA